MTTAMLPSGTGIVSTYAYDDANRLTSISHVKGGLTTVASVSYTLDDVGNRTQRVDQQGTHDYEYDDLYRLTEATYPGPSTTSYEFDEFGNRTEMTDGSGTTTYAYDDADRLTSLTKPGPTTVNYTWNDNGDLTARGGDSFTWDYEDRMTSATVNSVTTNFTYRGDGLRNSRQTGMTTTTFTWDVAAGLPVVIDDGNQYVYGATRLGSMKQAGDWYYYLADGLGSTMAIVDDAGAVVNSYTYDVYGDATQTGSLPNEFDFAGQQTDATGLQYLRARYVDPETGGFISRDPLSIIPAWLQNNRSYGMNNPTAYSDPAGLSPQSGACGAYGAGLGICHNGGWTFGASWITTTILNGNVPKASDSKFKAMNGGISFCSGIGKKSSTRTISIGFGEYATSCEGISPQSLDPRVSCTTSWIHGTYMIGGDSYSLLSGECRNQFGGIVGTFVQDLQGGTSPKVCGAGIIASLVEGTISAGIIAGWTGAIPPVGGTLAGLLVGAGVGCAAAGTWTAIF